MGFYTADLYRILLSDHNENFSKYNKKKVTDYGFKVHIWLSKWKRLVISDLRLPWLCSFPQTHHIINVSLRYRFIRDIMSSGAFGVHLRPMPIRHLTAEQESCLNNENLLASFIVWDIILRRCKKQKEMNGDKKIHVPCEDGGRSPPGEVEQRCVTAAHIEQSFIKCLSVDGLTHRMAHTVPLFPKKKQPLHALPSLSQWRRPKMSRSVVFVWVCVCERETE